jgi:hypothetical protein
MGATTDFFMPMVDMFVPVFTLKKPRGASTWVAFEVGSCWCLDSTRERG